MLKANKNNTYDFENKRIAVLIPCYNESLTIEKVVKDFKKVLPNADIYVYDNNSTDGTDELAKKAGAIVKYEPRQGKGNVIRTMFRDLDYDCYLMVDGDDTYPADNAKEMCNFVLSGKADMVIGDRLSSTYFTENKRPFHNIGNVIVRYGVNHLFHAKINDIMTGYRAFSFEFVKTFPVISKGFEIETEMSIHAIDKNMKLVEIPVQYRDRPKGSNSKLNTYKDGAKVLHMLMSLYREYKPSKYYGWLSLILYLIALIIYLPVLKNYPRFRPGAYRTILASLMLIGANISLACKIILGNIAKHNRQDYELKVNHMMINRDK